MHIKFYKLYNLLLNEKPENSNVVVWLQGDRYDRAPNVLKMYKQKIAKKILISGNNLLIGPRAKVDENNISLTEMKDFLLKNKVKKDDILVDDKALNTAEQAYNVISLAKKNKWKKIILVSSSYNQPRAFLSFLKQAKEKKWKGLIYNRPADYGISYVPGGRSKNTKKILIEEITKIKEYKKDIINIDEGLEYMCRK